MPSFFFNDTATTEIYTLSLHDALPIWLKFPKTFLGDSKEGRDRLLSKKKRCRLRHLEEISRVFVDLKSWQILPVIQQDLFSSESQGLDRKSTRLNSSHQIISYALFFF